MEYLLALVVTASAIALIHLVSRARGKKSCKLPPGSMGLPVIGQTFSLLRAVRGNRFDEWVRERIEKYGPVSRLSVLCAPTVLLAGPEASKFLFFSSALRVRQVESFHRIVGGRSMQDLHGDDHRRVRGAVMEFLKPDMLKMYVGKVDAIVRQHLEEKWYGRTTVTVMPLMKRLTFDIISSLLFGLDAGDMRDALAEDFPDMMAGVFVFPVNLPFTAFSRSLKASQRARRLLQRIIREKKAKLGDGHGDLISALLSLRDEHGDRLVTDGEILDNSMFSLLAAHDSTSVLLTFMVRHLANDPVTLAAMVHEHEEVAKNKADGDDALTWEDLSKMKFTWRVAQETLRTVPPGLGIIRRAFEDVEFDGYCIPKGWQVLLSANATHMDPSIFPEPDKFDPSRFERPRSATPPCSFIAWGGGPRICPGMDLAKIETVVMMYYLVRYFRWTLCCKDNTFGRDPFPSPLLGLPIKLDHKTSLTMPPQSTSIDH
ncbi:unnamed protein product [Alopecurus aequalis]